MRTLYLVGSHDEAEWLSQDLGIDIRDTHNVSMGHQRLEGLRLDAVKSTRLARVHPLFEASLHVALHSIWKRRPLVQAEADFGLRSHEPPWAADPTYLCN